MKKNKFGFTLIELLIVIAVMSILGTIAFLSYQNYGSMARDSKRVTDLKNIVSQLHIYESNSGTLPKPDDYFDIMSLANVIGYQGYIGFAMQKNLSLSEDAKDNQREEYYSYNTNATRDLFALTAYFENSSSKSSKQYNVSLDNNKKLIYTVGNPIGVLINKNDSELAQKSKINIDVESMTDFEADIMPQVRITSDKINYLDQIYKVGLRESCQDYLDGSDSFKNDNTNFLLYKDGVFTETVCDMPNL